MKESTFDLIKKIMVGIIFSVIVIIFVSLLVLTMDDKFIKGIKDYIKTDTKVLYISDKKNFNEYPIKLLNKYEVSNKYIDAKKLSSFEKTKIENLIKNKDLSNIIVIFESGHIKDALIRYETKEELNNFFIKNSIIPEISGDVRGIKNAITNSLESDSIIVYLPYVYSDKIEYQDNLLKNISKQYNVEYKKIDAYLLSKSQHQKINLKLDISDVEDQIVLFIKNKEILGTLRGFNRKSEYINKLFEYGYVDEVYNSLNEINYEEFNSKIQSDNKSIILIIKDDCKYCKEAMNLLNQISSSSNLDVDYINVKEIDNDLAIKIEEKLKNIEYTDGFSTPLLIITEKNSVLDYSIGISSLEFYEDMFKEYGLLK